VLLLIALLIARRLFAFLVLPELVSKRTQISAQKMEAHPVSLVIVK
jgi:hypothetical protein